MPEEYGPHEVRDKFHNALRELKQYIALAIVEAPKYQQTNIEIIKELTERNATPGVYVTLNRPYENLRTEFEAEHIDTRMIIFIDAVTETAGGKTEKTESCLFIGSPQNLSDISIAMDQAVRAVPGKEKFLFFDSLNVLLIYNAVGTVARFIHFLATKMRVWGVKGIIISLQKESNKELVDEIEQLCDKRIDF